MWLGEGVALPPGDVGGTGLAYMPHTFTPTAITLGRSICFSVTVIGAPTSPPPLTSRQRRGELSALVSSSGRFEKSARPRLLGSGVLDRLNMLLTSVAPTGMTPQIAAGRSASSLILGAESLPAAATTAPICLLTLRRLLIARLSGRVSAACAPPFARTSSSRLVR